MIPLGEQLELSCAERRRSIIKITEIERNRLILGRDCYCTYLEVFLVRSVQKYCTAHSIFVHRLDDRLLSESRLIIELLRYAESLQRCDATSKM